jgi:putative transcriptional regulator
MENGIKEIRLRMGMTQQAFADMLGCTQGNVGHYEIKYQTVPPDVAKKLIFEAAVRGHRVTYEDIYGAVDAPVIKGKIRRDAIEQAERKVRYAED